LLNIKKKSVTLRSKLVQIPLGMRW